MTPSLLMLALLVENPQPATPPPVPPVSAEQRALALELVELVQPELSYRTGIDRMTEQMMPSLEAQMTAGGKALPPDFRKRFSAAVLEVVPYDEMVEWSAELYAQRFTVGELKELIGFYKTPVGRKISLVLPELMGEVGKKVSTLMPERLPAALRRQGLIPAQKPPAPRSPPAPTQSKPGNP
jgi:uncharacterized protein